MIFYTVVCLILQWCYVDCLEIPVDYTLPGRCPDMKVQSNLDYSRFAGHWYTVAQFSSFDTSYVHCNTVELQEDNLGYTLTESYVHLSGEVGNRTKKLYNGRVDPTFDAGNKAKLIVSLTVKENIVQFPVYILSTDYDNYCVWYTCKGEGKKIKMHFAVAWIMTRSKDKLEGQNLKRVEEVLAKYPELAENRDHFVHNNFSDASCAFDAEEEMTSP